MKNPLFFPEPLFDWLGHSFTCEFATVTTTGQPLTHPITPHPSVDGRTVDLATGLAYPLKAERARNHRKVGILFSNASGSKLANAPMVLIKGEATVRDADLQANTDRYVAISAAKFSTITRFIPERFQRTGAWYLARIWIHVTPIEIVVFPRDGGEPSIWRAAEGTTAPPSDPKPAPSKSKKGPAFEAPLDYREGLRYALANLGTPVVTVVDEIGFPIPARVEDARLVGDELVFPAPRHALAPITGKACATFHTHPERFTSQENLVFTGVARQEQGLVRLKVDRQIGSFTLGRSVFDTARTVFSRAKDLHARMRHEAERRGQPVPRVRFTRETR